MTKYRIAAALLSVLAASKDKVQGSHAHTDEDNDGSNLEAWSYIPATIPTPLSDMAISVISISDSGTVEDIGPGDGDVLTNTTTQAAEVATNGNVKKRIIITGGCDSPDGNTFVEEDWGEGFTCFSLSNKAYAFDPIRNNKFQAWNGEFETLADMPRTRNRHASAVVNNHVCVFGGRNETDTLIPEVDCYNPDTNEWSTPTSLPEERQSSDFAAFEKDGKVHLIGGYDPFYTALDRVTIVDMNNFDDITYSDGSPLVSARGDIDVALVDGAVYVSGGFTHENYWAAPKNSVERFNMATEKWADIDALNQERGDKQLVASNGKVYAIGGETKVDVTGPVDELPELGARSEVLDSVEVLDPNEDVHGGMAEWRSLAGMPTQLFRFAASEWDVEGEDDGYIFVFGGQVSYDSDCKCFRTTDKVMVFDIAHAQQTSEPESAGVMAAVGSYLMSSVCLFGLIWFNF